MIGLIKDTNGNNRYFGKYRGFIVDKDDPKRIGRVKVQVQEVQGNVDSDWAAVMTPSGGVADVGTTATYLVGAKVWVEFERGLIDKPIIVGFWVAEPEGVSDLPRLAREDDTDPATTGDKGNDTASTHTAAEVKEPDPEAVGEYPRVSAQRTVSGMVREMDDSGPRMQDFHPSNSYREVRSDGAIVDKSVKNRNVITQETLLHHVKAILEVIDQDYISTIIGKLDEESNDRNMNVKSLLTGLINQIQMTVSNGADVTVTVGALSLAAAASALTLTLQSLAFTATGDINVTAANASITAAAISLLGSITVGGPIVGSGGAPVQIGAAGGGKPLVNTDAVALIDTFLGQANGEGGTYAPGSLTAALASFSTALLTAS